MDINEAWGLENGNFCQKFDKGLGEEYLYNPKKLIPKTDPMFGDRDLWNQYNNDPSFQNYLEALSFANNVNYNEQDTCQKNECPDTTQCDKNCSIENNTFPSINVPSCYSNSLGKSEKENNICDFKKIKDIIKHAKYCKSCFKELKFLFTKHFHKEMEKKIENQIIQKENNFPSFYPISSLSGGFDSNSNLILDQKFKKNITYLLIIIIVILFIILIFKKK